MSAQKSLRVDHSQEKAEQKVLPQSSLLVSSHQAGWKNIQLANFQVPPGETPEIVSLQHIIFFTSFNVDTEINLTFGGDRHKVNHPKNETGLIEILPAFVPMKSTWNQTVDFTHCYLEPGFLTHCVYESVNPDKVEIELALQKPDPLIWQICHNLRRILETDASNSQFYADSMATALAAHFLRYYSIRKNTFKEYGDGLPTYQLRKVTEYMNENLGENISLADLANLLNMSQFYFCRLFKQSTGITPHAYLVKQRIERSKLLLKQKNLTIDEIASHCGFANPSHFAKCFRRETSLSPKQFRML